MEWVVVPLIDRKRHLLELISVIDSECRKNGIWYSLAAGSVLGAVRHQGFIPWDEDIDIFVKSSDLPEFRRVMMAAIPNELRYFAWDKEYEYHPVFDRMGYAGVSSSALYVDIFPLIGAPSCLKQQERYVRLCYFTYRFFRCKHVDTRYSHPRRVRFIRFLRPFTYVFSDKLIKRIQKRIEEKYDLETSDFCYYYSSGYGIRACMPKRLVLETHRVPFEHLELNIPVNSHEYLSRMYGDYMTPKREGFKIMDKYLC
jgi:lipopolysaccharide cholinephosphotransferase